jgi:hypothetical protein
VKAKVFAEMEMILDFAVLQQPKITFFDHRQLRIGERRRIN